MSARNPEPAVWILWTGEGEDRAIHSVFGTRDAACHKLCDLVMRGQELAYPKITRQVVKDAGPITPGNADAVAAVISAVRGLNSVQKRDIGRATLARLWTALQALAYPKITVQADAGLAPWTNPAQDLTDAGFEVTRSDGGE